MTATPNTISLPDTKYYLNERYRDLQAIAREYKQAYQQGDPFPNIAFENFFNPDVLDAILDEFPNLESKEDIRYQTPNEIKLASRGERRFGPVAKAFAHFLNSEPFLLFLQELTGIDETLMPDPYFEGGGFHQTKPGGFLKIHADFNKHRQTGLDRRLNVLVYLNKDWMDDYGGHFELWDRDMTRCVKKILPAFNTMAMFTTSDFSYHGLPNPLTCPPDRSRKSLALYYYTNGRPAHEINHGLEDHTTLFKARKGDEVDAQMKKFNTKQAMKDLVKDLLPPILTKTAKKVVK
ncbi:MAG: 2OG-Fe(II) oxygenase [Lewinellaceae bacterium]|nr:2OG-Fe(II) oxygenase [Saprospiraceae bacterium]MCB9341157.1 2OG-Fe(II) oxygenase [Lewinellaceae bacterium]